MCQRENASARRMGWKSRGRMRAILLKTHLHPERFWGSSEEKGEAAIATVCVGDASHPPLPPSFHPSIMPFTFSSDRTQQIHRHPSTRDDDSHSSHTFTHTQTCAWPSLFIQTLTLRSELQEDKGLCRSSSSPVQTHTQLLQYWLKTKHGRSHKHTADMQTEAQDHRITQRRAAESGDVTDV